MMVDDNSRSKSPSSSTTESIKAEATEQASRLAGGVKDEAKRYEKDLRSGVAERAESLAAGLRKAGSEIEPNSSIATMFDRAADTVSGLADSLNATDPREMVDEVRRFARRQPGAFLGLSALAGFAAVRFLRAGSTTPSNSIQKKSSLDSNISRPSSSKPSVRVGTINSDAQAESTSAADHRVSTNPLPISGGRGDGGSHA
ncbi:hypothetical protein EOJ32_17640 (plasmid) [Paracoccus sp. Arc7-R13]|uniref:hypothetical protein n=1 Tax=Paracoccus sp. Arc7-R13 TaxID=2500532 RepID=UPI000FDC4EEE|nr:hypothetical protein [Paracoccus sp. Arc7-R13]AZY95607.1 hypothetical protein EOJ32_17640 [Paracoccus sp. Arc7-R13]